ncbi:uncharacterized protein EDB91DRAFT_1077253 [Suillus paluster]|uniref:uncharacterized protein n=1 Tax=Suillus paluster TaxID=48578 RepID=UPI001B881B6D|nr:uncharacterized protein EDB91DRAFT_1077253 [Suillus paluster]KAG1755278.1 hypothetical protein EDB91DRAFT_1077253 [Suillus paluster]
MTPLNLANRTSFFHDNVVIMEIDNLLAGWPTYTINFTPEHPGPLLILRLKDASNFRSTEDDDSADEAEGTGNVNAPPVIKEDPDVTMVCEATSKDVPQSSPEPMKLGKRKNKWSESPEPSRPSKRKHKNSSGDTSTNDLISSISSGSRKHTTRKHEDSKMDDTELYRNAGRKTSSLLDTFGIPSAAFRTGLQFDQGDLKMSPISICYFTMASSTIFLVSRASSTTYQAKKLNMIIAMVLKGMSDGRSADLSSIKHKGLQYIGLNMYKIEDKSMRGLNHPQLAHLLCPRKKLFYKHLFIGPSSVMNDLSNVHNSAKPSKNCAWGLTAVNKYIIAYVHIITYFMISSAQHWTQCIGDMDLDELLWAIIEMLDNDNNPWVKDTLAWWNSDDDIAQIRAQQATCRSALAQSNGNPNELLYDNDDDEVAPLPTHPRQGGQQRPLPKKSLPQHHHGVFFSDDEEDKLVPAQNPTHRSESDARERRQSNPHIPLPPKFKPRYSTEAAGHNTARASIRAGPADSDGEEPRPRSSEQHHPASASVHHDDEDQPPRPKPKPKPKPKPHRTTRNEHEDSVGVPASDHTSTSTHLIPTVRSD